MFLKVQGVAVIEKRVDILLRGVVAIDDIANRDARGPHYFVGFSLEVKQGIDVFVDASGFGTGENGSSSERKEEACMEVTNVPNGHWVGLDRMGIKLVIILA